MNNKPRVLIVDDVSSNIHLLMNILKDDYTLIAATNGEKAISLTNMDPQPDIILLDVVMPDIDGYEVCRRLKQNKQTAHIPIVFVTSLNSIEQQEEAINVGAIDFITKPLSRNIVLHKVKTYCKLNRLTDKKDSISLRKLKDTNTKIIKPSILVVDDTPENIQVMIQVLKNEYTVTVATSGAKALEILNNGLSPDLILLDVVMPKMDGYEFCELINQDDKYKHIPIIFVTILEHEKDIVKGFELGAVDYVVKPIEPVVLKARINTHLKLKGYSDKLIEDIRVKEDLIMNQSKLALLGEMFENVTHQWKQPLSSINVTTTGIKIQKDYNQLDDEKLLNGLNTIENAVKYLSDTVDAFGNFLINDSKKYEFNIEVLISRTLNLLSPKLADYSIVVENNVENVLLINYENDLMQVLMNIILNALDKLVEVQGDRKIIIDSIHNENSITIRIQDNAGGVNPENIDCIFDKYFTTKSRKEGRGLGLFISKKIVEDRLGGEISVNNISNGACFEIVLST